jgi:hypothetical protein
VLLALAGLAVALAFGTGEGAALATSWFAVVLGALAFGLSAGSAGSLPADRAEGRAAWLATLRPRPLARPVGAALCGALLAVGLCTCCAGLVGLLAPAFGLARDVRDAHELALPEVRRFRDPRVGPDARPLVLTVGAPADAGRERTLDVGVRPILLGEHKTLPTSLTLGWMTESASGELELPHPGRLRLPLAPADRTVRLELREPGLDLALREAVLLGEPRSFAASLAWAGLLLGLAAAVLAPFAVAVSRVTSAATATGATLLLVVVSAMRAVLPEATALGHGGAVGEAARAVLRGAIAVAPDFSGLAPAAAPAAGRALGPSALGGLLPLLPHAAVFVLLLLVPGRAVREEDAT